MLQDDHATVVAADDSVHHPRRMDPRVEVGLGVVESAPSWTYELDTSDICVVQTSGINLGKTDVGRHALVIGCTAS